MPEALDQAATLRRLFAAPAVRLLPVLMPERYCARRSAWMAHLAQCWARQGERVWVVDAARAQLAAALGLRARHDLWHALAGECAAGAALLDGGDGLSVLPASRALAKLGGTGALLQRLGALLPATADAAPDLLACLLPARACAQAPAGDLLVPLLPDPVALAQTLADLDLLAQRADTGAFRALFLGMDAQAAATLAQRIGVLLAGRPGGGHVPIAYAGAARIARDLLPVARAAGGWSLAQLAVPRRPRAAPMKLTHWEKRA